MRVESFHHIDNEQVQYICRTKTDFHLEGKIPQHKIPCSFIENIGKETCDSISLTSEKKS